MTVHRKTLLLVGSSFLLLIIALGISSRILILGGFASLETKAIETDISRVEYAINNELERLRSVANDWAPWDDTYLYIQGKQPDFPATNLTPDVLPNLKLNFMIFLDNGNQLKNYIAADLRTGDRIKLPAPVLKRLQSTKLLSQHSDVHDTKTGLLLVGNRIVLLASQPIVMSEYKGEIKGTLIVGRFIDSNYLNKLRETTQLQVDIFPANQELPARKAIARTALFSDENTYSLPISNDRICGYTILVDIYRHPSIIVEINVPRDVYHYGEVTLNYALLAMIILATVTTIIVMVFLSRSVTQPLAHMSAELHLISQTEDHARRLKVDRADELGVLSEEINATLEKLAQSKQELLDSTYRTGMTDMASGVIHNVRNALSPTVSKIGTLRETLRDYPLESLQRAREELNSGQADEERQQQLRELIDLQCCESVELLKNMAKELGSVSELMVHIETALTSHEHWAASDHRPDRISLHTTIVQAVQLAAARDSAGKIRFDIDDSVTACGKVLGEHFPLLQVFYNIIINAMDAIAGNENTAGVITISASKDNDTGLVRTTIADNGIGITPDVVDQIFNRGFTTKNGVMDGIGLHWCANAVNAWGGKIEVESKGTGHGASFHVMLNSEVKLSEGTDDVRG